MQSCPRRREIREDAQRPVDRNLPEEFQDLEGVEVESEADVEGLEAPPTVVQKASFDVSFFVFSNAKKPKHCKNKKVLI